jgi:hypothetical protein
MSYLDRLKRLDAGEKSLRTPDSEPTKQTEPPFDGFVGSIPVAHEYIHAENGTNETVNIEPLIFQKSVDPLPTKPTKGIDATSYRWLIHFAEREPLEVFTHPDANFSRMLREYPDCVAAEPLMEPVHSCATCCNSRQPGASRYCCARPELPPAYGDRHPLRLLPDDGGDGCGQWARE